MPGPTPPGLSRAHGPSPGGGGVPASFLLLSASPRAQPQHCEGLFEVRFPPASQKPQRADLQGCLCPGRPVALPLGEVSPPTGRRHPASESPAARVKPEPSWPLGLCGAQSARQPRCQSVDAKPRWVHPGEGAGCWPLLSPGRTSPAPQPPALLRCPELQKDWVLTSRLARGAGSQRGVCGDVSLPLRGRILRCSHSFLIL